MSQEEEIILTALCKLLNLPQQERRLIRDIATRKHISRRQRTQIYELGEKYLKDKKAVEA